MQVLNPVCGKSIHLAEVAVAEDDGGWTYFFCSTGYRTDAGPSSRRSGLCLGTAPKEAVDHGIKIELPRIEGQIG